MTETVEHEVDRTGWPSGEWDLEPDRVEWRSEAGLPCLILRNDMGTLCGYVGVPPGHPWHGQDHDDVSASVHGGLTYGAFCTGHICHLPRPGEPAEVYWLGFDCGHAGDLIPRFGPVFRLSYHLDLGMAYRNLAYVTAEVECLAAQAAAAQKEED